MWKQRSVELQKWLKTTPAASSGAKEFLQTRFGVRSAVPFVPAHAFGLPFDEMNDAPLSEEQGVASAGAEI